MSKVQNVQAVGDSGNDGINGYSNINDDDLSTAWVSSVDSSLYVEFDLQTSVKTSAIALKLDSTYNSRYWPKDMKFEVSNTGSTGPWSLAQEFSLLPSAGVAAFRSPNFFGWVSLRSLICG